MAIKVTNQRMFTGIIESLGKVTAIERDRSNVHFTVESNISPELKIDQSVSHNGVCLTVVDVQNSSHTVTAIDETLQRSNLSSWQIDSLVNLERCLPIGGRLDGHLVQGHVDDVAECIGIQEKDGSWLCTFRYKPSRTQLVVEKGSICINGVSLTVVKPEKDLFSVAIIPYTWEHTNFHQLQAGSIVNLEFDIIGKYIAAMSTL
ncbi:MAG: riboflavin synthase [Saprospiraceae bacterium]